MECQVEVDGNNISTIIDSGAAASIVTRDTIEQLGYEPEEVSNCEIITATGEKSLSLGKIRDFSITINGKQIPIDVEVMEADFYYLLLRNNWMTKAGTKNGKTTVNISCTKQKQINEEGEADGEETDDESEIYEEEE
ncbi:6028_t:CDS:2 [Dentiscutata erythropus]|uniref:6028_t:CDS:1 n=1 Tax=Dentiscutata erythropus TaxID=1348616 RepID=A0A9N9NCU1_9GLOM|nr:6028_t:CDS:2 [Dentiscutata erythropus]